ncbi:MAG: UbiX family flavin prenyltransferase [Candidatus Bathyarchaeia archaeon]|nr:UbiX family flavin prenyltransferase [Candidatus Bathyarchaeota archaeon]
MVERLIVAISGASGVIYAVRLLKVLKEKGVEVYLIVSDAARRILEEESSMKLDNLKGMASRCYGESDLDSPLNSGSFETDGMIVVPCSLKTLAGIALGFPHNLIVRAAEVTLKEGRKLVLVPRETPLSLSALRNMCRAAENGAVILPAMPAFYFKPERLEELVDYIVGKILDQFKISHNLYTRWHGKT